MKRICAAVLAASILTPAAALACSGSGYARYGAAVLREDASTSYLVNKDDGVEWANLAAPYRSRAIVAHYDPTTVDASNGWSGRAPVMKLSPDGNRQILWIPESTSATSDSVGIYELRAGHADPIGIPTTANVTGFDAIFDDAGAPLVLVSTDYEKLHLLSRSFEHFDGFHEIAQGDATQCLATSLALLPDEDGFIGLCGDHPISRIGDQLVVDAALLGASPIAVAGVRDGGAEVFFAVTVASDFYSVSIDRLTRAAGAWQIEHAADLPLGNLTDDETIAVASKDVLAIVGETSDTYEPALYVVRAQGAGWVSESAGKVDYSDRVSAVAQGDAALVLTGSLKMRLHTHSATGWMTQDLGRIGHETIFNACSVGGLENVPAMGPVLIGLASVLAFALRRRS